MKKLMLIIGTLSICFTAGSAKAEISEELIDCAKQGRTAIKAELRPLLEEARVAGLRAEQLYRPFDKENKEYLEAKAKADTLNSQTNALTSLLPSEGEGNGTPMTLQLMEKLLKGQCDFYQNKSEAKRPGEFIVNEPKNETDAR